MLFRYERKSLMGAALTLLALAALPSMARSASVNVPGRSSPYLAGMPNGSTGSGGDVAPNQSPVLAPTICLQGGFAVRFSATGGTANDPTLPLYPPDGNPASMAGHAPENGIAFAATPYNALVGVFLGPADPSLSPAPGGLDFSSAGSRDYVTLNPLLKQVFFIGNGTTTFSAPQTVIVPAGGDAPVPRHDGRRAVEQQCRQLHRHRDGAEYLPGSGAFGDMGPREDPLPLRLGNPCA